MSELTHEDKCVRYNILKACVDRMDAQGYGKKKKDDAALEFLIGATQAMIVTNHELKDNMLMICMLFSARGAYGEAKRMMKEFETEKQAA